MVFLAITKSDGKTVDYDAFPTGLASLFSMCKNGTPLACDNGPTGDTAR